MAQQQPTRASPEQGLTTAYKVMADAARFFLANGGAAVARAHVDSLAKELVFYPDCTEAYRAVLELLNQADREEQRRADERQQQQQRDIIVSLMGVINGCQQPAAVSKEPPADAEPDALPAVLATDKAMAMWPKLQRMGFVDDHYQPTGVSRTEAALLANEMARRLSIRDKWKTFGAFWHRNNMRGDYNDALEQRKTLDFLDKLKTLFADFQ